MTLPIWHEESIAKTHHRDAFDRGEGQQGHQRATYGQRQFAQLSQQLRAEFGRGFDVSNLHNMRAFYQAFPKQDAVRLELSWTHYRTLIRVENRDARQWYLQESIEQNWSARALSRQIDKLYYERLLSSQDKVTIKQESAENTQPFRGWNEAIAHFMVKFPDRLEGLV